MNPPMKEYHPKIVDFIKDIYGAETKEKVFHMIADALYDNTKELLGDEVNWNVMERHMKDIFAAVDNFRKLT